MRRNTKATAPKNGRYMDVLEGLKLGVGVRADFAVQVDLFVLRGNPFHERCSFRELNDGKENSTIPTKMNRGNPLCRAEAWYPGMRPVVVRECRPGIEIALSSSDTTFERIARGSHYECKRMVA
jgi:hypothetical protein